MDISETTVKGILTRTGGFLRGVVSHSLQPYRGCSFGNSLCGVGCYVQHNAYVTAGRPWGSFLEVRTNAAEVYRSQYLRERKWGQAHHGAFSIFCSSSTDPFLPQEARYRITRSLLQVMSELPPDRLILQTHSDRVTESLAEIESLHRCCALKVHLSIETDRDRLPGLPPHASSVAQRLEAARQLKTAGIFTVITVAPLLPIQDPFDFFGRIAEVADAVVIDHFIGGDGSASGARTQRTQLPIVMAALEPGSDTLAYRDDIVAIARQVMPGKVGVGSAGFAGDFE